MTKLEEFVQDRLHRVKRTSDTEFQNALFHQAFGAIEFACSLYSDYDVEIGEWWNNIKWHEFQKNMGG